MNLKKIILKFLILCVALALNGNQFDLCKGNNSNNKLLNVYNFRIKSGIDKWSIHTPIYQPQLFRTII